MARQSNITANSKPIWMLSGCHQRAGVGDECSGLQPVALGGSERIAGAEITEASRRQAAADQDRDSGTHVCSGTRCKNGALRETAVWKRMPRCRDIRPAVLAVSIWMNDQRTEQA